MQSCMFMCTFWYRVRNQEMVLVDMLTEPGKAWQYCPKDVLRRFSTILEDEFGLVCFKIFCTGAERYYWSNAYLYFQVMNVGIEVEFYLLKSVIKYVREVPSYILFFGVSLLWYMMCLEFLIITFNTKREKKYYRDGKETWAAIDRSSYCSTAAIDVASSVLEEVFVSLQSLNIIVEQVSLHFLDS